MKNIDRLVEQHILQHESHLKHIDELLEKATEIVGDSEEDEVKKELKELGEQREKLLNHIDELKQKSREDWQVETIEQAGPLIIWELVAKRLEKIIERIHV